MWPLSFSRWVDSATGALLGEEPGVVGEVERVHLYGETGQNPFFWRKLGGKRGTCLG